MKLFCSLVLLFVFNTSLSAQTKETPTTVQSSERKVKEPTLLELITQVKNEIAEITASLEKIGVTIMPPEHLNPNDLDSLKTYLEELKVIRLRYSQTIK